MQVKVNGLKQIQSGCTGATEIMFLTLLFFPFVLKVLLWLIFESEQEQQATFERPSWSSCISFSTFLTFQSSCIDTLLYVAFLDLASCTRNYRFMGITSNLEDLWLHYPLTIKCSSFFLLLQPLFALYVFCWVVPDEHIILRDY